MHHEKLDYNKQCLIAQFLYVQAHMEPNPLNSQAPWTLDCLYLWPLSNVQEGHKLLNFKVTIIPMTETVIQTIEELAKCQGMKGLKLCTKSGHILFDLACIAGVDYYNFDDYSNGNDHEKVIYDYEEVKYERATMKKKGNGMLKMMIKS